MTCLLYRHAQLGSGFEKVDTAGLIYELKKKKKKLSSNRE